MELAAAGFAAAHPRATNGEFTDKRQSRPEMTLERTDQVADRSAIDRYFAGGVDDLVTAPWTRGSVYPAYDPGTWSRMPIVDIDPRGLMRTQRRILTKHLVRAAAAGHPDGGDLPWIVRYGGQNWVIDGHHRIANAVHNGHATIAVRVIDMDAD